MQREIRFFVYQTFILSKAASLKRISTEFLGRGPFKSICFLRFENKTVLHLQSYAILPFYSEISWVVAANGYSQIYDSDFIMKCFGNNFLERCLHTLLECIALNSPQRTLVWELDCRMTLFCLVV